ncbi:hypothetical protein [Streptomyces sp. NBC_00576]|uniref:hypothetical protein n=1 Tax=Streptomyces sp. NBC_00576 TaxID=2903665 RepID=UPI003FCD9404
MRVRGCGGRETAQWWGLADPGKPHGQPAGFWTETSEEPATRRRSAGHGKYGGSTCRA